jgi:anti-sigma regulatory factor (Ser/Thr protein kinase)
MQLLVRRRMSEHLRAFVGSTVDVWKVGPRDTVIWAASEALATAWPLARLPYTIRVVLDVDAEIVVVHVNGIARSPERPLPLHGSALEGAWRNVVRKQMGLSISKRVRGNLAEIKTAVRVVNEGLPSSDPGWRAESVWSEWRDVPPTPAALAPARQWLSRSLGNRLSKNAMDEVQLLTSELITNALLHAPGPVSVRYCLGSDSICVEVRDARIDLTYPAPSMPDPNATSGRGLALVHRLATRAGVTLSTEGKVSWFEYALAENRDGPNSTVS